MHVFTMVAIVVTVGCLTGIVTEYLKTRREEARARGQDAEPQIAALEERVRVLEKIVTDERYELRRELKTLDDITALEARAARRG